MGFQDRCSYVEVCSVSLVEIPWSIAHPKLAADLFADTRLIDSTTCSNGINGERHSNTGSYCDDTFKFTKPFSSNIKVVISVLFQRVYKLTQPHGST